MAVVFFIAGCFFYENNQNEEINFLNDRAGDITGAFFAKTPGVFTSLGLTGTGQIVAIADSGLDKGSIVDIHPDLKSLEGESPKVILLKSWSGREKADDPLGHGTHMAATIAGNGNASNGKWEGIAPKASIYFQGLLNENNEIKIPDIESLFTPAYEAGARIHVDAWGSGINEYGYNTKQIDKFINSHDDFLVILSSGNNGPSEGSLTSEANSKNSLVVGSSTSTRPLLDGDYLNTNTTATFSSKGSTKDGRIKPDLLAPGTSIISAKSSLISGNLTAFPQYTSMQGTSMSAATTGGISALSRELLQTQWQIYDPSAAFMKALLIQGARTTNGPSKDNFGIIDFTSTAIAVKEKSIKAEDEETFLKTGESKEFKFTVNNYSNLFKATLVWTDAFSGIGSNVLINDLDLEIICPNGEKLLGNNFLQTGVKDSLNNVEQIYLANPQVGEYTIVVKGAYVSENISPNGQDFALVYGQLPSTSLLKSPISVEGSSIFVEDGVLQKKNLLVSKGYRQYLINNKKYFIGKIWYPNGVGVKENESGVMWFEAQEEQRVGGYSQDKDAFVLVNGKNLVPLEDIPLGAGMRAVIDPLTQTLQKANIGYELYEGTVGWIGNEEEKTLSLDESKETFTIGENTAYENNYRIKDSDYFLGAFGSLDMGNYQTILSGMEVSLVKNTFSNKVQAIVFDRDIILGSIENVQLGERKILLDNGKTYLISPDSSILLDNQKADFSELKNSQMVSLVLAPYSEDVVLGVSACSKVSYGQLVFISFTDKQLYFYDLKNGLKAYEIDDEVKVIRWGKEDTLSSLQGASDIWAMLIFSSEGTVESIKVAEKDDSIVGVFEKISNDLLELVDDRKFYISNYSNYQKNGLSVLPTDFMAGEKINATTLFTTDGDSVIASLENTYKTVNSLGLKYISVFFEDKCYIAGKSEGNFLYIWRENKLPLVISCEEDSSFKYIFTPDKEEKIFQLVVIDRDNGKVDGAYIYIPSLKKRSFIDLSRHWAKDDLEIMASRGVFNGYKDGTVRPDNPITHEEMAVILNKCFNWNNELLNEFDIKDEKQIYSWAVDAVYQAVLLGIMTVDSDYAFNPKNELTRGEMARIVANIRKSFAGCGFKATKDVSESLKMISWQKRDIFLLGIYQGDENKVLFPNEPISRAEVAAVLVELVKELQESK